MRRLIDLSAPGHRTLSRRSRGSARPAARIREWIQAACPLPTGSIISVNEARCGEPGCPEVETVVGVFRPGRPPSRLRFDGPPASVRREVVVSASQTIPP